MKKRFNVAIVSGLVVAIVGAGSYYLYSQKSAKTESIVIGRNGDRIEPEQGTESKVTDKNGKEVLPESVVRDKDGRIVEPTTSTTGFGG